MSRTIDQPISAPLLLDSFSELAVHVPPQSSMTKAGYLRGKDAFIATNDKAVRARRRSITNWRCRRQSGRRISRRFHFPEPHVSHRTVLAFAAASFLVEAAAWGYNFRWEHSVVANAVPNGLDRWYS